MIRRRIAPSAFVALGLIWTIAPGSANAELPPDYQVLVRGATVDAQALPPLVLLPDGPFATTGLDIELILVPHQDDDWILYDTSEKSASAVQPARFTTVALTASYYDPSERRTRAARVNPSAGAGGASLTLEGGETDSIANLLQPTGAMVLIPVPEPALLPVLAAGVALLCLLRLRPRPG